MYSLTKILLISSVTCNLKTQIYKVYLKVVIFSEFIGYLSFILQFYFRQILYSYAQTQSVGGEGNPLQCSCLGNPMDGGTL